MNNRRTKKAMGSSPLQEAIARRDRSTLSMVQEAVRHKQCLLAFQPVVLAAPPHETALYEGFIRVLDNSGRIIPARDFIGVIEDTETGRELDCVALQKGLRTLAQNPSLRLSINMSARSIGYRGWMQVLNRFLKQDKTLGERLILEMTEASVMKVPELVADFMTRLQPHGICFALDDFGSGALTLHHFRRLYFDAVKIDGQFVRGVHRKPENQSMVRALAAVAREFDMLLVAESVEKQQDAEYLASDGVDFLQGFLFGAPSIQPPWAELDNKRQIA